MATRTIRGKLKQGVVRIGRVVEIISMAPGTVVRRKVVIAIVTNCTIVGDGGMRSIQCVKAVVIGKTGWIPARLCRVASGAISGKCQGIVVRIDGLVEIIGMAKSAIGRGACITRSVALNAFDCGVPARQWKCSAVVVKDKIGITSRVAGEAGRIVVAVPIDFTVFVVCLRIGVAVDTSKNGEIGRVRVAVYALVPFAFVFPAENRKILPVVVKSRRGPSGLGVASFAIRRKLQSSVIRI